MIGLLAFDMPFDSTYVHVCCISIEKGLLYRVAEKKIFRISNNAIITFEEK